MHYNTKLRKKLNIKILKKIKNYIKLFTTYFCELRRLDLSLTLRQLSSLAIVTCRFFSGSVGDGRDLGVVGVEAGDVDLDGGGAKLKGGGARVIGGSLAFSAPN